MAGMAPPVQPTFQLDPYPNRRRPTPTVGTGAMLNDPRAFGGSLGPAFDSATYRGEDRAIPRLEDAAADIATQRGTGRVIANQANTFDPAGSRAVITDREGAMRRRVAARAATLNDLAARTAAAPSAARAQTNVDLSRSAAVRGGLGAGGPLGMRQQLARAARSDQGVVGAAGQRAGQEAVSRLAERASYTSGGGQVISTGAGASIGMLKSAADTEQKGVQAQTDLVRRGTNLDRDLAVQQGRVIQGAGNTALDWQQRRGMAAANASKNIGFELAAQEKFRQDMAAIEDQRQAGLRRQVWTTVPVAGQGIAAAADDNERRD